VKPGDLVGVKDGDKGNTYWLYHPESPITINLIPTDIRFGFSDTGLILESRVNTGMYPYATFLKILTPRGIGWANENWVEKFQ
jgi:hypothetical protein